MRRHPDSVFLLALCLTAGIGQVASSGEPASVESSVPPPIATLWGVVLIVGAVVTLTGIFWRGTSTDALMVEATGRVMFAPPALAYAIAIVAVAPGFSGWLAAAPFVGFSLSCVWRIGQVIRDVGGLRNVLRVMDQAADDADDTPP